MKQILCPSQKRQALFDVKRRGDWKNKNTKKNEGGLWCSVIFFALVVGSSALSGTINCGVNNQRVEETSFQKITKNNSVQS